MDDTIESTAGVAPQEEYWNAFCIPVGKGQHAIIDLEDWHFTCYQKWYLSSSGYAMTSKGKKPVFMHRLLLQAPKGLLVDHINLNKLDNRRANLRLCTDYQNSLNKAKRRGSASRYKGVWRLKEKWAAEIKANGVRYHLGSFCTEHEAAEAYNRKAQELHGSFAYLNPISAHSPIPIPHPWKGYRKRAEEEPRHVLDEA